VSVNSTYGGAPGFNCNSAQLTTGANSPLNSAGQFPDKAQLFSYAQAGTALSNINNISYWSYRSSVPTPNPAVDLALNVKIIGGGATAFLVYEPYNQSGGSGAIVDNTWQNWDATATTPGDGVWWSSGIPSGPGSQGSPQPWSFFQTTYAGDTIDGYGFNLGSNNPNTDVAGDGLIFGATTTDF
jgi:hypothetical protein